MEAISITSAGGVTGTSDCTAVVNEAKAKVIVIIRSISRFLELYYGTGSVPPRTVIRNTN